MWLVDGSASPCIAYITLKQAAQLTGGVGTNCAVSTGANGQLIIELFDNASVLGAILSQNAGSSLLPRIYSPGGSYSNSQNSGTILGTYNMPAFADNNYSRTDNADLVQPDIAAQVFGFAVEPVRDIIIARVIPRNSGRYLLTCSLNFLLSGVPNVFTIEIRSRRFAATTTPGNATQVGYGVPGNSICYVAAADGSITYAPASTGSNLFRQLIVNQPANIPYQFSWTGIVDNQGVGFTRGVETIFAVAVSPAIAATVSGPSGGASDIPGTITAVELDQG